jgi:ATP-binding cassette subfamily B protein
MIKLFRYLKPFIFPIIWIVLFLAAQAFSDLYLPTLMADIVDKGILNGNISMIFKTGLIMILVALAGSVCSVAAVFLTARTAIGFGSSLREKLFSRAENFSLNELNRIGSSSLITRTTNDITQVQQAMFMILRMMVSAPLVALGGIFMAVTREPKLSLILVFIIPVLIGIISLIAYKGMPLYRALQLKLDGLNRVVRENLAGIRVIRAFNRDEREIRRFDDTNRDLTATSVRVNKLMALFMPMISLIMNLTIVCIIWFGGHQIDRTGMPVGSLMAFIQYIMQIMFSLVMVSFLFVIIPRASVSAGRINEVLNISPEIRDPDHPAESDERVKTLEFRDVTFRYPGAEQPALSHVSFSAEPGKITAVIGGTGSGKSTLMNLVLRFYDIDDGQILINNTDIRDMKQEALRSRIGLVTQQSVLFTGSVADNIRFGRENASEEEVVHAAETAQAHDFISKLTDGYEEAVAQNGRNFSGGQKQRLAIARALIRKPEIYIFDDSFSALDYRTDADLRKALRSEINDSVVLIVAQRVSTVMDADRIIVLEDGFIRGAGTHEQLMETCPVYNEIVLSQMEKEEIA